MTGRGERRGQGEVNLCRGDSSRALSVVMRKVTAQIHFVSYVTLLNAKHQGGN